MLKYVAWFIQKAILFGCTDGSCGCMNHRDHDDHQHVMRRDHYYAGHHDSHPHPNTSMQEFTTRLNLDIKHLDMVLGKGELLISILLLTACLEIGI